MTREELFQENLNLVPYCVYRINPPPSEFEDSMQEGYLELWRVCGTFDDSRGIAFSTYAVPCIFGYIRRYLREKTNVIRVPRIMYDKEEYAQEVAMIKNPLSMETPIDEDGLVIGDMISSSTNEYEDLIFEESMELALEKVLCKYKGKTRDLLEEFYYDCIYGEKHSQNYYSRKYKCSQAQVSRRFNQFKSDLLKQMED